MPATATRTHAVLSLLVVAWLVGPAGADERVTRPFAGITYIDRTETSPRPLHMHVVQIDLSAPGLRFKSTRISSCPSLRPTPSRG